MNTPRHIVTSMAEVAAPSPRRKLTIGLAVLAAAIVVLAVMYMMQGAPSSAALGVSLIAVAAVIVPFGRSRVPHEPGVIDATLAEGRLAVAANRSSLFWGLALSFTCAVAAWCLFVGLTDPQLKTGRYILVGVIVLGASAGGGLYQAFLAVRSVSIVLDSFGVRAVRGGSKVGDVTWSALAAASASKTHLTLFSHAHGSATGPMTWDVRLLKSDPQAVAMLINECVEADGFSADRFDR